MNIISQTEAQRRLGVSRSTVERALATGRLTPAALEQETTSGIVSTRVGVVDDEKLQSFERSPRGLPSRTTSE